MIITPRSPLANGVREVWIVYGFSMLRYAPFYFLIIGGNRIYVKMDNKANGYRLCELG